MKHLVTLFLVFLSICSYAQKDSLQIGDRYWEDQLYINISYNILSNQPKELNVSGFSFGFSGGYIKDIPLVKSSKIALGVGLGYGFDSFNHHLKVVEENLVTLKVANVITVDKLKSHNIEMPIQFRLRTSTVNSYSFWRIYTGIKLSYNLNNSFSYTDSDTIISTSNLPKYNKFQTGLTLSVGYSTFNFHVYYGLTPILKNGSSNKNTNIIRIGLSFYLL
ncbi:porin family protein [Tenacibaculum pacificus]|uniref:porin family protein n=1 Tax=Tenacibaculum pacificus TaxID=3018314 RepID=UPI0022F37EF0|nr:porin family protein [Tenacibaculum pacificus]WBX73993.1 porin family protein [Tenacibaculum pacificus]